ncbi:MAG: calcium/sodium antiporter [Rhodobacterales bacterium]|nr:calcium/sodium antiporter [Rhodobacterales bacterium]
MDIFLLIVFGLAGLVFGGDILVRGAVDLARRIGLPPLVIGLTLVGFGTSTPELVTSLQAAFAGSPGIAAGNVIGSNIANILLILGFAALLAPVTINRPAFLRDGTVLALSALLCLGAVQFGHLTPAVGLIFITVLIAYLSFTVMQERGSGAGDPTVSGPEVIDGHLWKDLGFIAGGLALTILGARFLVTGAIDVAGALGISETVIGLTIVAVGTSLPELVTTIAAARRGQSDIAFGNVIGSNIFNTLFILGATALIHPIDIPASIAAFDIWVMTGVTLILLIAAAILGRVSRVAGAMLLAGYVSYNACLALTAGPLPG